MKHIIQLCCFSLLVLLVACKKDNHSLPPETQNGANTFGCKINDKVWVPMGSDGNSGQNIKAYYQRIYPSPEGYVLHISGTNYELNPLEKLAINSDSIRLFEGMKLKLGKGNHDGNGAGFFVKIGYSGTFEYVTNETYAGELKLTRFDELNRIASGTFWFDAYNPNSGETIQVREGRFDVKFTR